MVFSTDDHVLIKVMRQEKGYGAKNSLQNFPASQIWGKLQERVYRSRIHDVDQLKSCLIEEWEHFHQVFIDHATRQCQKISGDMCRQIFFDLAR